MLRRLKFAFAAVVAVGTTHAGTLRKIWDIDAGAQGVYALGSSPDGHRIVAVVGPSGKDEFVLVLDAADPKANNRRLAINPELGSDTNYHLSWSPSGRQVLLSSIRVRVEDGKTCLFQDRHGMLIFSGEDRVVNDASRPVGPLIPDSLGPRIGQLFLNFFNSDCQSLGSWSPPNEYGLFDASAERGLVFVRQGSGAAILDSSSRIAIQRVPLMESARFADSGKAICGVVGAQWAGRASCLDVDTGKELATSKVFTRLEINSALHSRRVVLSDYRRFTLGSLKSRVVWDFGTGKQVVSWRPKSQTTRDRYGCLEQPQPYSFDISPDDEYIVEGGAGTISLYRIEP